MMPTTLWKESLVIQGGNATRSSAPPPAQNPTTDQDLQTATRDLREAIRSNIQQQITAARAQAAAGAQGATPATPTPSPDPRPFTIRGPDGRETVIGFPSGRNNNDIPPQAVDMTVAFFLTVAVIVIGLPLARAFARRMDRRGGPAQITNEVSSQLTQLNQAVDAIALEVERISEGQRFTTKLLTEQREARQTLPSTTER
jgi:hypothetical protein